ncbi:hypothetical protein Tco_0006671 [Tanacetum coccineum]
MLYGTLLQGYQTTKENRPKEDSVKAWSSEFVSQLAILGENISQEDLNLKFLRSLPSEWNTHVVVWRNKLDLDTMSIDDLYNNFKIDEQEVKRTVTSSSNLNSSSQNMTFVSSPNSTNEVNTANVQVSTTNSPISIDDTLDSTANLSDATIYAFLANQPNRSQLVHEDLEQIHEDDLEEMDMEWKLALLSMRGNIIFMTDEEVPTNMALMAFSNSEVHESDLIESLLNIDTVITSPKIDFLLEEFAVLETLLLFSSKIEDKVFKPGILVSKEEKPPHLLSHRGFKAFKIIHYYRLLKARWMIYGGDLPILECSALDPLLNRY